MKTLVVYYSYDEHCKFIAGLMKDALNADLLRVETEDDRHRGGLVKYIWGGKMTVSGKRPTLKPWTVAVNDYDLIVLGTPVWAGTPAPPMLSFLEQAKITDKKTALFVCHAGGPGRAMEKFKAALTGNTVVAEIDFRNPVEAKIAELKPRVEAFCKAAASV
jgi:flavodoxin